ncbi:MAG TPA: hypothetical protein VFC58_08685 [Desulfosporosinus sp.]|nr:hypothetical protein [Desulfosporosinus sp.]
MKGVVVLSCLTLNNTKEETMKRELGKRTYPIWLIVNPKYTAVRHDIWRPILAEIQDRVFRELQTRVDTSDIYIRSAVKDGGIVPNTLNWWGREVAEEIKFYRELVNKHKPKMLFSFGAFPFEYVRRVFQVEPEKGPKAWSNSLLKNKFNKSMENFDINQTNRIPLLRRVVEADKFVETRSFLSKTDRETYFQHVGAQIAEKIIENKDNLDIWIK